MTPYPINARGRDFCRLIHIFSCQTVHWGCFLIKEGRVLVVNHSQMLYGFVVKLQHCRPIYFITFARVQLIIVRLQGKCSNACDAPMQACDVGTHCPAGFLWPHCILCGNLLMADCCLYLPSAWGGKSEWRLLFLVGLAWFSTVHDHSTSLHSWNSSITL